MLKKISVLIDEPIQQWLNTQDRHFKVSVFVRDLLHQYITSQSQKNSKKQ